MEISLKELPSTAKVRAMYPLASKEEILAKATEAVVEHSATEPRVWTSYEFLTDILVALEVKNADGNPVKPGSWRSTGQLTRGLPLDKQWGRVRRADGAFESSNDWEKTPEGARKKAKWEQQRNDEFEARGGVLDENGLADKDDLLDAHQIMDLMADRIDRQIAASDAAERIARRRAERRYWMG